MVWGKCIELLNCRGGHALGGLSAALFRSPPPPRCIRPRRRSVPVQLTARVYASAETHWQWFEAARKDKKIKTTPDGVVFIFGSPCWARTNDNAVNSRVLYRLS